MNLREVGLGPEGAGGVLGGAGVPAVRGHPPGWPSLGVWVGPPFTAADRREGPLMVLWFKGVTDHSHCPFTECLEGCVRGCDRRRPRHLVGVVLAHCELSGPWGLQSTSEHIGCNQGPKVWLCLPKGSLLPKAVSSGSGASLSWAQLDI